MFLTDEELIDRLEEGELVEGVELGEGEARYARASQVQPCSLDLRIGDIYIPGKKEGELGSHGMPSDFEVLPPGGTAVVITHEKCKLPSDIGAFGFPPNTVSAEGILMTNPGHVDPGFKGPLMFTVINMSERDYPLQRNKKIVTLLFFAVGPVKKDLGERGVDAESTGASVRRLLDVLSSDFLGITKRIREVTKSEEAKTKRWAIIAPIAVGLIAIVGAYLGLLGSVHDEISELKARVHYAERADEVRKKVRVNKQVQIQRRRSDRAAALEGGGLESP